MEQIIHRMEILAFSHLKLCDFIKKQLVRNSLYFLWLSGVSYKAGYTFFLNYCALLIQCTTKYISEIQHFHDAENI